MAIEDKKLTTGTPPIIETISLIDAKKAYYNEIKGLLDWMDPSVSGYMTPKLFYKQLRKWADNGRGFIMLGFSDKFPREKYPGIIDDQPHGTVAKFDAIANEINNLYKSGSLTQEKILEVSKEMEKLCYS